MTDLILAADMSEPAGIPAAAKAGVRVILGYTGGATPYAWTAADVARAVHAVGAWWPIWTAPNPGVALSAAHGATDGAGMVAALRRLGVAPGTPCFYDIERSTWDASRQGAHAAVAAWRARLAQAGYRNAWPYWPWPERSGWVPNWTVVRPATLPAGVIGWQYQGQGPGRPYDLSVFEAGLLEDENMPTAAEIAAAVWGTAWPDNSGKPVPASVWLRNADIYAGHAWLQTQGPAIAAVVKQALSGLPVGADADQVAAAVVKAIATQLSGTTPPQ